MRRLFPVLVFVSAVAHGAVTHAAAPADLMDNALRQLEADRYALARSYLDPLVIDPRLTAAQRSQAYYYRGYAYFSEGLLVSALQDYNRALEFDSANPAVQAAIAHMYARGLGVPADLPVAFELFLKAARGNHTASMAYVGFAQLTGRGVEQDVDKARFWLGEAAEAGDVAALAQLARSYRAPFSEEPDPTLAAQLYREAIDKGSVDAEVGLGYMALNGELGAIDGDAAIAHFRASAERGSAAAETALGYAYLAGKGVPQDYDAAREWYLKASRQDHAAAYLGLAHIYENGLGVQPDPTKARGLYNQAAALGDVSAQLRSAAFLLDDTPDLDSVRTALELYLAAAGQGAAEGHNGAAWLMATSRHDQLRDGPRAVGEAERAVELASSPMTLDTLAAAHAETGDFEQAISTQQAAIDALSEESDLAGELREHLETYQRGEPWRE